jgi:hypothetical protein
MSYKVFQIQNAEGKCIGNHQYYTKLGSAKNAAHNCTWSLDDGCKIVELEINEVPISEIKILIKKTKKTNYSNKAYFEKTVIGFSDKVVSQEEVVPPLERIKFN